MVLSPEKSLSYSGIRVTSVRVVETHLYHQVRLLLKYLTCRVNLLIHQLLCTHCLHTGDGLEHRIRARALHVRAAGTLLYHRAQDPTNVFNRAYRGPARESLEKWASDVCSGRGPTTSAVGR